MHKIGARQGIDNLPLWILIPRWQGYEKRAKRRMFFSSGAFLLVTFLARVSEE